MTTSAVEQRIRLLPENLINQIAAGEVILRPASVLKELLENSIDAQARTIQVWTEEGGKERLQVTDDGIGMSPMDAELCFERHTTSKISSLRDLYHLETKGFRGEALASIAAVAHVELFARRPTDELGTHIVIAFGERRLKEVARCKPGSTFIVTQLFRQLPVRRKSLRSTPTEHRHNLQEFLRVAYPHPEVAFEYYADQQRLYFLPPLSLKERLLALHPDLAEGDLLPVYEETPLFTVEGFLLVPEKTPPDNRENYLFINRRYIRHGGIQQALWQVCRPLLRGEARPQYWLFLTIPPNEVDINIVPSKTEVRLIHEVEIRQMLNGVLRKALACSYNQLAPESLRPALTLPLSQAPLTEPRPSLSTPQRPMLFHPQAAAATETQALLLFGRYLVLAVGEEGAWILDVWRAYQRVTFEVFQKKGPLPSQGLLFPVHAPIEPPLVPTLQSWQKALVSYGFEMELRENREAVLHALPAGFAPTWAAPLLEKLLKQAREASETTPWPAVLLQIVDSVLASQRPRTFTLREATDIAEHLLEASDPNFTPRGQAIRFFLSQEALRQLFE